jgi:hypothetical protein
MMLSFTCVLITILGCIKKERNTSIKNLYKQKLESRDWQTTCIIGNETDEKVVKFLNDSMRRRMAGFLASFENNKFTSRYVAPCGNDYFTQVYGKYEFYERDKIMIAIDSITYSGEWKKPVLYKYGEEIHYLISKDTNNIIFTKIE